MCGGVKLHGGVNLVGDEISTECFYSTSGTVLGDGRFKVWDVVVRWAAWTATDRADIR